MDLVANGKETQENADSSMEATSIDMATEAPEALEGVDSSLEAVGPGEVLHMNGSRSCSPDCLDVGAASNIVNVSPEPIELCASHCLYLKPIEKLDLFVMLPENSETDWTYCDEEVIAQLKNAVSPDQFSHLRVSQSTKDFIQLEAETETKTLAQALMEKLHGSTIKVSGLNEDLSVKVTEALSDFPKQHEWETSMTATEEIEYGQAGQKLDLPYSIYLEGLPCKWFLPPDSNGGKPSEDVLRMVFERFGSVKNAGISMFDPSREELSEGVCDHVAMGCLETFKAYVQYEDYEGFAKAMESLQGMKLMFKGDDGKHVACIIKVTLDSSRHFIVGSDKERCLEKLNLQELEQEPRKENAEESERKITTEESNGCDVEKEASKPEIEQQKKDQEEKPPESTHQNEVELWLDGTAEWEERKYILAQRRVESMKLLTVLLEKVQEYVLLDNFTKELLLNFDLDEDSRQKNKQKSAERRKVTTGNNLKADLDSDESSEWFITSEGSVSEYKWESEDDEGEKDFDGGDSTPLSTPSSPSYDIIEETSEKETKREYKDRLFNKTYKSDNTKVKRQMAVRQDYNQNKMPAVRGDGLTFTESYSQNMNVCYKKPKIYETDEFINYLLNYYEYPSYTRLCLEQGSSESESWWERVVVNNENGFMINITNLYGHYYTDMNVDPTFEQQDLTQNDHSTWHANSQKSQGVLKRKSCPRFTEDFYTHWEQNECKLPVTKHKKTLSKNTSLSPERLEQRLMTAQTCCKRASVAHDLKDVLEQISSESEAFSEVPEDFDVRSKRLRIDNCRLLFKKTETKNQKDNKRKGIGNTPVKGRTYYQGNTQTAFGLHFSEPSHSCGSHCKCKYPETCEMSSGFLQPEDPNSETESNEEEQMICRNVNRKKAPGSCSSQCFSENDYDNQSSYFTEEAWEGAYEQNTAKRKKTTQPKGRLKTSHQLRPRAHPLKTTHKGPQRCVLLYNDEDNQSACTSRCEHCQSEQPSYDYSCDNGHCQVHHTETKNLPKTKPFSFYPKGFNDYMEWEQYFYANEEFDNVR